MSPRWQWEIVPQLEHDSTTYRMNVPGGWVLRVRTEARPGRGPDYQQHPIASSEAMVFIPTATD